MKRKDIFVELVSGEKRRIRLLLPEHIKAGEKLPVLYPDFGRKTTKIE